MKKILISFILLIIPIILSAKTVRVIQRPDGISIIHAVKSDTREELDRIQKKWVMRVSPLKI
jgi:uncharacterized protein YxeA